MSKKNGWRLLTKAEWDEYISGKYPILRWDGKKLMIRGTPKIKIESSTTTVDTPWYSVAELVVGYTLVYQIAKLAVFWATLLKKRNKRG